jgi:transglutaminase superfamily protein
MPPWSSKTTTVPASDLPLSWRIRAGVAALVIPPLIHIIPLHRLAARLGRRRADTATGPSDASAAAWIDAVLRHLPWPWHHTCLKRSAVLYHLLRRDGAPVELQLGVRRTPGGPLAAHAWLVRDGMPYLEEEPEHIAGFTPLARFPEAPVAGR